MSTIKVCDKCGAEEMCIDYNERTGVRRYLLITANVTPGVTILKFDLCEKCLNELKLWVHKEI